MYIFFLKVYTSDIICLFWPIACDCNGRSQECYFDPELYRSTGHGGHCTNCRDNTDGAKCERCRENFFRLGNTEACSPCHCSPVGEWQEGAVPLDAVKWHRSPPNPEKSLASWACAQLRAAVCMCAVKGCSMHVCSYGRQYACVQLRAAACMCAVKGGRMHAVLAF